MATLFATPNTMLGAVRPANRVAEAGLGLVIALLGTLVLALSARIAVPFAPVPATFQTLAVAVLAAAFGLRVGVLTVALYIAEGLMGLPVFAAGGGPAYVFSPTFGFILSWLAMAMIIGQAADAGLSRRPLLLFGAMLFGDALSFVAGYAWLVALWVGAGKFDTNAVYAVAFDAAVKPFILLDILKMAFAALTVTGGWAILDHFRKR